MRRNVKPLSTLVAPVQVDFERLKAEMAAHLHSQAELIDQVAKYVFGAGGKYLRPLSLLICARACGCRDERVLALAVAIEYIHVATLLHDDVVDRSQLRRGQPCVHTQWGNETAVLVGDFLYSRAFQLLLQTGDLKCMQVIANTTNLLAEGEALQLFNRYSLAVSENDYLKIIQAKTAMLFSAAAQLGGILAGVEETTEKALADYGLYLGTAFQIMDDILDYEGNSAVLGKATFQDLQEGKVTLPLIHAFQCSSEFDKKRLQENLSPLKQPNIPFVQALIQQHHSLDYAKAVAQTQIETAINRLQVLPESEFKQAAIDLAWYAIQRKK